MVFSGELNCFSHLYFSVIVVSFHLHCNIITTNHFSSLLQHHHHRSPVNIIAIISHSHSNTHAIIFLSVPQKLNNCSLVPLCTQDIYKLSSE